MSKQIFLISFLAVMILGFGSCNKSITPAGCSTAWASELSNEVTALSNAAQTYASNPTQENCLAYKAAAQNYVDALKPYGDCATLTGTDRAAWQDALNNAQQSVDEMNCQ